MTAAGIRTSRGSPCRTVTLVAAPVCSSTADAGLSNPGNHPDTNGARSNLDRGTNGYHPRDPAHGDTVMFELLRSSSLRQLLARQAPALVISLVVAEMFYKFGSFTLECLGFLATWFVLDAVFALVARKFGRPATEEA